jgi:hypothetical protein
MDTFLSLYGVTCTLSVRACVARRIFANSKTSREIWERRRKGGGGGEVYPLFSKISFSKTNLFQLLTLLLLLLLNNSSTKANGRDHGRSLDAERGEKTAAPSKNPFQTHWNCR